MERVKKRKMNNNKRKKKKRNSRWLGPLGVMVIVFVLWYWQCLPCCPTNTRNIYSHCHSWIQVSPPCYVCAAHKCRDIDRVNVFPTTLLTTTERAQARTSLTYQTLSRSYQLVSSVFFAGVNKEAVLARFVAVSHEQVVQSREYHNDKDRLDNCWILQSTEYTSRGCNCMDSYQHGINDRSHRHDLLVLLILLFDQVFVLLSFCRFCHHSIKQCNQMQWTSHCHSWQGTPLECLNWRLQSCSSSCLAGSWEWRVKNKEATTIQAY